VSPRLPCEFFLIRYVPDVVKGEFVNIGVVLREAASGLPSSAATQVRFTRDWARVRCMDAEADVALLEGLEQEIGERLRAGTSARDPKAVVDVLEDSLSNSVQISPPSATLAENLATEMELLLKLYVEPMKVVKTRVRSGRAAIAATMRTEFERAGAWPLMRKRIAAAMYTRPGDPLRIDCGYRPNGVIRMFQAVSLENDVEMAKGLAYSAPQLREGVGRVEGATLELTAVVEPFRAVSVSAAEDRSDELDEAGERYRFGVEAMERQDIRVITLNDLARAAATAQRELGL
jgi:hypothetical protein